MPNFEIEFNNGLYSGTYDVTANGLDLHNVVKHDDGEHPITKPSILKQLEEAIENEHGDDIAVERQEAFFVSNGRLPEREYDC